MYLRPHAFWLIFFTGCVFEAHAADKTITSVTEKTVVTEPDRTFVSTLLGCGTITTVTSVKSKAVLSSVFSPYPLVYTPLFRETVTNNRAQSNLYYANISAQIQFTSRLNGISKNPKKVQSSIVTISRKTFDAMYLKNTAATYRASAVDCYIFRLSKLYSNQDRTITSIISRIERAEAAISDAPDRSDYLELLSRVELLEKQLKELSRPKQ